MFVYIPIYVCIYAHWLSHQQAFKHSEEHVSIALKWKILRCIIWIFIEKKKEKKEKEKQKQKEKKKTSKFSPEMQKEAFVFYTH